MVFGEDNRFAKPVTRSDSLAVGHQVLKHLVDGIGIEEPLVDRRRVDLLRDIAIFIPLDRVPLFLLFLAQVVIANALTDEFQRHGHGTGGAPGSRP